MAQILPKHMYIILTIFAFSLFIEGESTEFATSLPPKSLHLKHEKLTHLHFYWHEIITGANQTKVTVAQAPPSNTTKIFFGAISVLDDALRVGHGENSTIVGRAQGMYAASDDTTYSILMALTFKFTEGIYNGSTLSILGRNQISLPVREVPIVGGTGVFRFARGYTNIKTYKFISEVIAIMEMNLYVYHYGDSEKY
ncbi:dirigent protein 1-like [Rutidosis leptorrhynchoides]|uniref:dirigent protein 1-like n=1 Tax=Rutidosis leptorrhynchoides TaxID=125765 RepID=UPI003A99400B